MVITAAGPASPRTDSTLDFGPADADSTGAIRATGRYPYKRTVRMPASALLTAFDLGAPEERSPRPFDLVPPVLAADDEDDFDDDEDEDDDFDDDEEDLDDEDFDDDEDLDDEDFDDDEFDDEFDDDEFDDELDDEDEEDDEEEDEADEGDGDDKPAPPTRGPGKK
jgi:hypothetical protein